MSYVVELQGGRVWSGADWLFREMFRSAERLLPGNAVPTVRRLLASPRTQSLKTLSLVQVPKVELAALLEAIQGALADAERRGPSSFASPEFFPGYIERTREFSRLLAEHILNLQD